MSNKTTPLDNRLHEYLIEVSIEEPEIFRQLREETQRLPSHIMQIAPEQGQFMALLVQILGATRTLEIGTFTGYSALWVASALPDNGKLLACDVSEEWTRIAQRYWKLAGVAEKIDLRLGPALDTLQTLIENNESGSYDFAFIDAAKQEYDGYYESTLQLLRPGGVVALDNTLWGGKVADPTVRDEETEALRSISRKIRDDTRVSSSLVPIGDGLLLARKLE